MLPVGRGGAVPREWLPVTGGILLRHAIPGTLPPLVPVPHSQDILQGIREGWPCGAGYRMLELYRYIRRVGPALVGGNTGEGPPGPGPIQ